MMSSISPSHRRELEEGITCLPPNMRARAKLDWCRRWEQQLACRLN
ncbi:MAG: hypothetical protein AAGC93_22960 [Cyanobacteria bacterium P01_F01_bin.53]